MIFTRFWLYFVSRECVIWI